MFRFGRFLLKDRRPTKNKHEMIKPYMGSSNPMKAQASFREVEIDPFSDSTWQAYPFRARNMPQDGPDVDKYTSKKSILHVDDKGEYWHVIDVRGMPMRRLAGFCRWVLPGRHYRNFRRKSITGDQVIIVNAIHIFQEGAMFDTHEHRFFKSRRNDSRGPKRISFKSLFYLNPASHVAEVIKKFLPKNMNKGIYMRRLHIYPGAIHPHHGIPQVIVRKQPTNPVDLNKVCSVNLPLQSVHGHSVLNTSPMKFSELHIREETKKLKNIGVAGTREMLRRRALRNIRVKTYTESTSETISSNYEYVDVDYQVGRDKSADVNKENRFV